MTKLLYIDLFCGAGGTSTGVEAAKMRDDKVAKVIACVNHDANAIASHAANHPDAMHFTEDIRTLDLAPLAAHVSAMRELYPDARVVLWASLECTNFSIAKGGQSRDADSRTLAEHLFRYIEALNPDFIQIENVKEFTTWGPLIIKEVYPPESGAYCPLTVKTAGTGKNKKRTLAPVWIPDPLRKGEYYRLWVSNVKAYGYNFRSKILDSADYGAYTSRRRFFGIFAKGDLPIIFPEATHAKNPQNNLFSSKKKWRPVRDVLDFADEGKSIFDRKKPLVAATYGRLYSGLVAFVAGGKDAFMVKWNSMSQKGAYVPPGVDVPCPVVTVQQRLGVAQVKFISKYFSGHPESKNLSIDGPAHTVTARDHHSLVSADFLTAYYGNGFCNSVDCPAPTVTTKDRFSLVQPRFLDMQYGNSKGANINAPAGTVTTNPKHHLVTCKSCTAQKSHYLMIPQYTSKGGSIDKPCFTIIARTDKMPPYLVSTEHDTNALPSFIKQVNGGLVYEVYDTDCPEMVSIKEFMALYGIVDIKMRMLKIPELKRIMGFPQNYVLVGTQAEQKKYIGNAVEVTMARVLCEALGYALEQYDKRKAA